MRTGDLLELFRDEMADQATPYLWGDDLVFGYIDDAQNRFCRLTDGISDATTAAVTQIAITPATQWYPYHSSIIKLRQAYRVDPTWPDLSDDALTNNLDAWLGPFVSGLTSLAQVRRIDLQPPLESLLTWQQRQELPRLVPTHLTVPSGSHVRLDYDQSETPVLAEL